MPAPLRRNRDYLLLWVGQSFSLIGSQSSWVAYPLLVLALTGSAAKAGVIGFASWLPYLVLQLPAGALVDRWDRKRTMLACDALRTVAVGSVAVALPLGWLSFWQLVVVAFVERSLTIFFGPAETAALTRIVPGPQLGEAVGRNDAREYVSSLLGPPLGGLLFGVSRLAPFAADAVSYAVSFVSVAALRTRLAPEPVVERKRLGREVAEGFAFIWRLPFVRDTSLQAMATNVTWSSLSLALIVVARGGGASPARIGLMFALLGVGGILGSAASAALLRRLSTPAIVIGSVWYWAAVVGLLVLTTNPYVLGIGAGAALFMAPAWNGAAVGRRLQLTPDRLQGRVQAAEALLSFGARPFGLLATGYLLDAVGGRRTIALLAAWTLAVALVSTASGALRHAPAAIEESGDARP